MRPRQLATVALLLLVAGCGPSAEERYQNAVQLHETEQKELDRLIDQGNSAVAEQDKSVATWASCLRSDERAPARQEEDEKYNRESLESQQSLVKLQEDAAREARSLSASELAQDYARDKQRAAEMDRAQIPRYEAAVAQDRATHKTPEQFAASLALSKSNLQQAQRERAKVLADWQARIAKQQDRVDKAKAARDAADKARK